MQKASLRSFAYYVALNILGTLGVSCYILADTWFVAQSLGGEGIAALNIAIPVFNLINGTAMMLGMGGGTRYMLRISCGESQLACEVFTRTLRMGAGFSAVLVAAGALGAKPIAALLGADAQIIGMTTIYLRMILLCSPSFIANQILLGFLRNDGAPRRAMAAMLTSSFSNILLDWVFLFLFRWGMFGAVFATCLSPVISIGVMLPFLLSDKRRFRLQRTGCSLRRSLRILSIGGASFITELSNGVVILVFNLLMRRFAGNTGVAAYAIIANIALVVIAVFSGVSQGMQPLVSGCTGRDDAAGARGYLRYALCTVVALFVLVYGVLFAFADPITMLFNSDKDMELQRLAVDGLRLYFIGAGGAGVSIITAVYLACREHALASNVLSLLRGLIVIVPAAFLLAHLWQITGVWLTFPVTEGICMLVSIWCILHDRSAQKSVHVKSR